MFPVRRSLLSITDIQWCLTYYIVKCRWMCLVFVCVMSFTCACSFLCCSFLNLRSISVSIPVQCWCEYSLLVTHSADTNTGHPGPFPWPGETRMSPPWVWCCANKMAKLLYSIHHLHTCFSFPCGIWWSLKSYEVPKNMHIGQGQVTTWDWQLASSAVSQTDNNMKTSLEKRRINIIIIINKTIFNVK